MTETKRPSLLLSSIPIIFLIVSLVINVRIFGDQALDGSIQIILLTATALCCTLSVFRLRIAWTRLENGILTQVSGATGAILILLFIGALSGSWMLSGVVPTLIYYGVKLIDPAVFLLATCAICAIVSVASGSSWTTVATIGIALLGIGEVLGFDKGWIAGAIISGAYFGDKMSPLSDTTNLAAGTAGVDLFTHVRYMTITTVPSMLITLIVFGIYGFTDSHNGSVEISEFTESLQKTYRITPWLFLVPIVTLILIVKRVPAIVTLFVSVLMGAVFAGIFQPELCRTVGNGSEVPFDRFYAGILRSLYGQTSVDTGNDLLNNLVTTKGMSGMLNTIWLIMSAMCFGGAMEASGMLQAITNAMIRRMKTLFSTVAATSFSCVFLDIVSSDQYVSIVLPGKMFSETYKKKGYPLPLLSRTLEDSATVTSVLIPWNTCGMTQASVLNVATLTYLPYCFFNIISPFMTLVIAAIGYKIRKTSPPATDQKKNE